MFARTPRRGARAVVSPLPVALAVLVIGSIASAAPAAATPWGNSGADYTGVLCRAGAVSVPMGSWTVNGSLTAYSVRDIAGNGPAQQPAPVSGTATPMQPGQAGFSASDITAFAYLLAVQGDGSAVTRAEISAQVAQAAGDGRLQSQCLGQNGTSAARASSRLASARRFAGPYTVAVQPPSGVIPGQNATVRATVRSAQGVPTPGVSVTFAAGADRPSAVTDGNGVASVTVAVPAASATRITATVAGPLGLTYVASDPPSVAPGATGNATGTGVLRPVLHPKPAVSVTSARVVLSGGTAQPSARVTGTFGYSGTGTLTVFGPVGTADTDCSTLSSAQLTRGRVVARDPFTFTGDAQYRGRTSPALSPGCFGVRADVTTTNSSPPERASSLAKVTVATLQLATTAGAPAAAGGGATAVVTGTDAGRAKVTAAVQARGPLPVSGGRCTGDFDGAPVAASSESAALRDAGGALRATFRLPALTTAGCYALVSRSRVSLNGSTANTTSAVTATATVAILRPSVTVAGVSSGTQGSPVPGDVRVSGTFGFPGTVSVGVVAAETLPITGCRDARFANDVTPESTAPVRTAGDTTYAFRTPPPPRTACYAVVATFRLLDNAAVTARSGPPSDSTIFLAGARTAVDRASVVQRRAVTGNTRALITLGATGLVIVLGCLALFARTFRRERERGGADLLALRPDR